MLALLLHPAYNCRLPNESLTTQAQTLLDHIYIILLTVTLVNSNGGYKDILSYREKSLLKMHFIFVNHIFSLLVLSHIVVFSMNSFCYGFQRFRIDCCSPFPSAH